MVSNEKGRTALSAAGPNQQSTILRSSIVNSSIVNRRFADLQSAICSLQSGTACLAGRGRLGALASRVGPAPALPAIAAGGLGFLRRRSLRCFVAFLPFRTGLGLAAEPVGGGAQAAADALRLGLRVRCGLFGLGVRVVLA